MVRIVRNKSKNTIIAKQAKICRNFFSKALGLMFSSEKKVENRALVFAFSEPRKIALHMLFVFYPIDVLFLDDKKRVVELATLKPFCIGYISGKKSKYVIECKNGTIAKTKTKIGDEINF